jgi:hypothetical protein
VNETDASRVLLIRALETEDRDGSLVPETLRRRIARDAGPPPAAASKGADLGPREQDYLLRRAGATLNALGRSWPTLPRALDAPGARRLALALPAAAFCAGAAFHDLGSGKGINILAFPLLGMLLWNLAVYVLLGVQSLRARSAGAPRGLRRLLVQRLLPARALPDATQARALTRFAAERMKLGAPLFAARAAAILHLCAALLAAGAVTGMYLRGLAFEYRAGWESTFLEAQTVGHIVGTVLAPAAALSGIDLPRGEQWQALQFAAGQPGENAARWIHLYAITAALFVALPRLLLAGVARLRARRLAADFPLPPRGDPYFSRLLAAAPGATPQVMLICYSYRLPQPARQGLEDLLRHGLGETLRLPAPQVIDYGAEDDYLAQLAASIAAPADWLVLVFSLAATPEHEIHGRLCDGLAHFVAEGRGARRLLVLVDESAYRGRLGGEAGAATRLAQRRKAWQEALAGHDIGMIDLAAPEDAGRGILDALAAREELPA